MKNVILVMHSSGLLLPPHQGQATGDERTPEQVDLWDKSVERIERILPGFLADAMAPPPEPVVLAANVEGQGEEKKGEVAVGSS